MGARFIVAGIQGFKGELDEEGLAELKGVALEEGLMEQEEVQSS